MLRRLTILALTTLPLNPSIAADSKSPIIGHAYVIDGDTLRIGSTRIRLFGIDAPETKQMCGDNIPCGQHATAALEFNIDNQPVRCLPHSIDRYGRTIATCFVGNLDLGREQVRIGQAVAYLKYSTLYAPEEQYAARHRLGLWQSKFTLPETWRRTRQPR